MDGISRTEPSLLAVTLNPALFRSAGSRQRPLGFQKRGLGTFMGGCKRLRTDLLLPEIEFLSSSSYSVTIVSYPGRKVKLKVDTAPYIPSFIKIHPF